MQHGLMRPQCARLASRRAAGAPATPQQCHRRWLAVRAEAAAAAQQQQQQGRRLLYDGIIFDMDGTLTEAHIDFADMRKRTGIPVGDLFVAMESWEEPERIKQSMDVILEIEADAAQRVRGKEGLLELLQTLRESEVKVALVTRNTNDSVAAFFSLIGDEWRGLFSEVRTREFKFVKPDKRLLLDVSQAWQLHPGRLLMVGDSFEDVEVGNAAGTATCLIAGGGNEAPGANIQPPPGAVPTFSVGGLPELRRFLLNTAPESGMEGLGGGGGSAAASADTLGLLGWSLRSTSSDSDSEDGDGAPDLDPSAPGAPAPGLDFVDWLVARGALATATSSFPRMGAAAGGLQPCERGGGHTVLHLRCGDASLTKMLASKGLSVVGADGDVAPAAKRGLRCVALGGGGGGALAPGALAAAAETLPGGVDVALVHTAAAAAGDGGPGGAAGPSVSDCLSSAALAEFATVLRPGAGRLCVEAPPGDGGARDAAAARGALAAAGYDLEAHELLRGGERLRLVARLLGS